MTNSTNLVLNNVLCYITSSNESKSVECIIDCCLPYYSFSQIKEAREVLLSYCKYEVPSSGHRGNKSTKHLLTEIFDFLKHCKENQVQLPTFVSNSYNSMPPVSGYEIIGGTLSVLIDELYSLKEELKIMKHDFELSKKCCDTISIKNDLIQIKQSLKEIKRDSFRNELRRSSLFPSSTYGKENCASENLLDLESRKLSLPANITSGLNDSDICPSDQLFGPFLDSEPSAPTLSQFSVAECNLNDPQLTQHSNFENRKMSPTPELYSSKVKTLVNSFNEKSPSQAIKKTPTIKVKSTFIPSSRGPKIMKVTDNEGFISQKKRNSQATGNRKPKSCTNLRGAKKTVDLYIGRCDNDITSDDVISYIENELNIKSDSCTELQTKIPSSKSFKLTVNINDRNILLSDDSWPEGIICRKFYSKRN